ncbi:hypothetical protein AC249_AIPGENE15553 [Exaiptasia diaphana]|nr:hypothetical protein AC249_AIPGENE15553 [Exaiptasia diaphana]
MGFYSRVVCIIQRTSEERASQCFTCFFKRKIIDNAVWIGLCLRCLSKLDNIPLNDDGSYCLPSLVRTHMKNSLRSSFSSKDISNDYFTNITCLVYSYDGTDSPQERAECLTHFIYEDSNRQVMNLVDVQGVVVELFDPEIASKVQAPDGNEELMFTTGNLSKHANDNFITANTPAIPIANSLI